MRLWASGAAFGFRRTIRHILGTALGIGAMALGVAAGVAAVVTTIPAVSLVLKLAGSGYLLYLAFQIGRSSTLEGGDASRSLGLVPAATFQVINPKAWIFALGAVTTFRPADLPIATGSVLVALTMMVVIVPTAALWAAGGGVISRVVAGDRARRIVSLVLAVLVIATVAYVWT